MTNAPPPRLWPWQERRPASRSLHWRASVGVGVLLAGALAGARQPAAPTAAAGVTQEPPAPVGRPAAPTLTREQQETFLLKARIIRTRSAPGGVTASTRVTLSDGVITHDAHVQTVDEARHTFQGTRTVELNFRDSWRYNVAAYRLSVLLGLDMVPVSVERRHRQRPAAFTWWVDDVMMDEAARLKANRRAPDTDAWNRQMYVVRVFDQLIYNVDRNLGNLLITPDWHVWMIDHTRAFRLHKTLRTPQDLKGCDRTMLARLEALDKATLTRELSRWLEPSEVDALLARRNLIVEFFRNAPPEDLFDLPGRTTVGR
jgi:hypothetical protein